MEARLLTDKGNVCTKINVLSLSTLSPMIPHPHAVIFKVERKRRIVLYTAPFYTTTVYCEHACQDPESPRKVS